MSKSKKPIYIVLFLRSLVFAIIMPLYATFYSLICVASFPLSLHVRCKVVNFWTDSTVWLLKVICKINYRVEGLSHIKKNHNAIVMSKHQSTWETFFLPGLFHDTAIIAKRELQWIPFFGWGLAVTSPIAINRSKTSSAMAQIIQQGKKFLQAGRWILIFPEGTRIPAGQVGKYRIGGARLAVETGYPILPVAHNAGRFWARRRFIKTPGTIHVIIGPLLESKGKTAEEMLQLTKDWIEDNMLQIDKCRVD